MKRWKAGLAVLTTIGTLWTFGAIGLDQIGGRDPAPGPYDAIIVAGCRVLEDGRPSVALARRADRAVDLWKTGHAPRVVFTGGVGDVGPTEASVAASYAESRGLTPDAVILEERSTSTWENAKFSADILESALGRDRGALSVLVVTDRYHVLRARRVFGRHFGTVTGAGTTGPVDARVPGSFREVPVLLWYGLTRRL
jgi:uncharacterized SAM-binding protein YcdF (DUF218 family)